MKMKMGIAWYDVVEGPLEQASSVQEVRDLPFPDPTDEARFEDATRYIDKYKGDYFIIGDGRVDDVRDGLAHDRSAEVHDRHGHGRALHRGAHRPHHGVVSLAIGKRLVELGVDGIWTGDDFGAQNGMMISPDMWRRIFKPRMAEVFHEFRAVNPDVVVMYHCDGAIAPILGDLIEIGLDVFNPVQPDVPGHEPTSSRRSSATASRSGAPSTSSTCCRWGHPRRSTPTSRPRSKRWVRVVATWSRRPTSSRVTRRWRTSRPSSTAVKRHGVYA